MPLRTDRFRYWAFVIPVTLGLQATAMLMALGIVYLHFPGLICTAYTLAQQRVAGAGLVRAALGCHDAALAFSACSPSDRGHLTYRVGWPRASAEGFEVDTDRECGIKCGEGNRIRIKASGDSWRAVEAETRWLQ